MVGFYFPYTPIVNTLISLTVYIKNEHADIYFCYSINIYPWPGVAFQVIVLFLLLKYQKSLFKYQLFSSHHGEELNAHTALSQSKGKIVQCISYLWKN